VKSVTGIDLSEAAIRAAQKRAQQEQTSPVMPTFILGKSSTTIDLPSASVDVLLCFDVLEHVMSYETVIPEWKRVLRNNGRVLIAWTPWYNPYAHHLENMIPLPWAHVFFSDKTLIETCARIYDLPDWTPAGWDKDADGNKKPNKWKNISHLSALNRLTMQRFEAECNRAELTIVRKQITGFSSPTAARLTRPLLRMPRIQEFVTSMVGYTLKNFHA
jgi:SAM-dependent methyltransferase